MNDKEGPVGFSSLQIIHKGIGGANPSTVTVTPRPSPLFLTTSTSPRSSTAG